MKFSIFSLALFFSFSVLAEIKTVTVGEYSIEYEMRGTGKATIFLEAGGSAGLNDWDPIYNELARNARTIRYSRVGNGNSSPVRKNYSSEEYAKEAHALLKKLNIKRKIVYVAHSYGAYIARIFASKYPEKMAALMLIEPASEHDVDIMRSIDLEKAEQEIAQVKLDDMKNGMSNQYLDFWSKRPLPDYPEIPDIPVTVIASVKKYDNPHLLFFTDEARNMWGKLHTRWAEAFPKGKALLTYKSYHYPQNDEPELVTKEIVELANRAY
jgi:pimeloyl-ACP methyl ester carboxylesterase